LPKDDDWVWPDTQNVTWEFPDSKLITWEGLSCTNIKPYLGVSTGAMIYGSDGSAFFGPSANVIVYDKKGSVVRKWDATGKTVITNTDDRSGGGWADSTLEHMTNFVDCIRARTPSKAFAHADIGAKSTFLALAANVAQRCGGTIDVNPMTGSLKTPRAAMLWGREYAKGWELA
jgi:hypothetical protein